MKIKQLSQQLANQIAAGEVVERPASVVKELIENSIDAGATYIKITLELAGKQLIQIEDNGSGVSKNDLILAVSRHATSKIYHLDDLQAISSLGFRGEALASISAISRLSIHSYEQSNTERQGWAIDTSDDSDFANYDADLFPSSIQVGTKIVVRELFFNTPARRKFLKADKTEFRHIETMVKRFAIGHPELSIELIHNKKVIFKLAQVNTEQQQLKRFNKLISNDFVLYAVPISSFSEHYDDLGQLKLTGWVADHRYNCINSEQQYFYVNGRYIRDKFLTHALKQAFNQLFPAKEHMAYVLFLSLDAAQVDVNVHPTKHEVRFYSARLVHNFIIQSLIDAFTLEPQTKTNATTNHIENNYRYDAPVSAFENSLVVDTVSVLRESKTQDNQCQDANKSEYQVTGEYEHSNDIVHHQPIKGFKDEVILPIINLSETRVEQPELQFTHAHLAQSEFVEHKYNFIQFEQFLIYKNQKLLMMDAEQSAAWINHQHLKYQYLNEQTETQMGQQLLVPTAITIDSKKMISLLNSQEQLKTLGIEFSQSSDTQILLRKTPQLIFNLDSSVLIDTLSGFLLSASKKKSEPNSVPGVVKTEEIFSIIASAIDKDSLYRQEKLEMLIGLSEKYRDTLITQKMTKVIQEHQLILFFNKL
ncbi:MAG: DNA mismatch repair endonuclease MutL [Gammaproteobacteria bacterium]|nr:DNA mismatch repair endonuclease MutL [Gammaproteobacteria bacterium]